MGPGGGDFFNGAFLKGCSKLCAIPVYIIYLVLGSPRGLLVISRDTCISFDCAYILVSILIICLLISSGKDSRYTVLHLVPTFCGV